MAVSSGIEIDKFENLVKIMKNMEEFNGDDVSSITVKINSDMNATITKNREGKWTASVTISEPDGYYGR